MKQQQSINAFFNGLVLADSLAKVSKHVRDGRDQLPGFYKSLHDRIDAGQANEVVDILCRPHVVQMLAFYHQEQETLCVLERLDGRQQTQILSANEAMESLALRQGAAGVFSLLAKLDAGEQTILLSSERAFWSMMNNGRDAEQHDETISRKMFKEILPGLDTAQQARVLSGFLAARGAAENGFFRETLILLRQMAPNEQIQVMFAKDVYEDLKLAGQRAGADEFRTELYNFKQGLEAVRRNLLTPEAREQEDREQRERTERYAREKEARMARGRERIAKALSELPPVSEEALARVELKIWTQYANSSGLQFNSGYKKPGNNKPS